MSVRYERVATIEESGRYCLAQDLSITPCPPNGYMSDGTPRQQNLLVDRPVISYLLKDKIRQDYPQLVSVTHHASLGIKEDGPVAYTHLSYNDWLGQSANLTWDYCNFVHWHETGIFPPNVGESFWVRDVEAPRIRGGELVYSPGNYKGVLRWETVGKSISSGGKEQPYWRGTVELGRQNISPFLRSLLTGINEILNKQEIPIWKTIRD